MRLDPKPASSLVLHTLEYEILSFLPALWLLPESLKDAISCPSMLRSF
jgi:hypothetical protein